MYEVFLTAKNVSVEQWRALAAAITKMCRQGERFELRFVLEMPSLRIFLVTDRQIPNSIAKLEGFMFRQCEALNIPEPTSFSFLPLAVEESDSLINVIDKFTQKGLELIAASFVFRKIGWNYYTKVYLSLKQHDSVRMTSVFGAGLELLDLDLRDRFIIERPPKYLNLSKTLSLADTNRINPIMSINTHPYLQGEHYLNLNNYDFYKHSVVFGASGAGKTKFLSNFISEIIASYGERYHILAIDPHDSLREEIGGLKGVQIFDFSNKRLGLDLFLHSEQNIINSVDMSVSLIKSLIGENWNDHLARLLRSCIYLLMENNELSFQNLRRLLTDISYKTACLKTVGEYLPESLQVFFGQEYNELKTKYYDITFARIIALIDELQLSPAFYRANERRLDYELSENRATIVSLNATKIGVAATKTIAGLIMNQLFALGTSRKLHHHIILIVDEVAVIENAVLARLLSEARKYNITVILAGQYYGQISSDLQLAIHANVANYFCFRLNYTDAELMSKYLNMELHSESQPDYLTVGRETFSATKAEEIKTIITLPDQQIIARVSRNGIVLPAVSGKSINYAARPDMKASTVLERMTKVPSSPDNTNAKVITVKKHSKINVFDLMREQSTSRRKVS